MDHHDDTVDLVATDTFASRCPDCDAVIRTVDGVEQDHDCPMPVALRGRVGAAWADGERWVLEHLAEYGLTRAGERRGEFAQLVDAIGGWHLGRWGDPGTVTMAAKLAEEVGEVCEAAVKVSQGHPRAGEMDYGGELADVVIVAAAAAGLAGVDLEARVLEKFAAISPAATGDLRDSQGRRICSECGDELAYCGGIHR